MTTFGPDEPLGLTVLGGSNSTHKVVILLGNGVPEPNETVYDADGRLVAASWINVNASELMELEFVVTSGTQVGDVTPSPEDVTPENPFVIDAVKNLGVLLNITRISKKASIIISNITEPEGVGPPPGTWKVLGTYYHISVSTEVEVNATIKFYYTDEDVERLGVEESTLKIYRWNETLGEWVPVEPSYVNTEENYVWAYVTSFSIFALMGDVPPQAVTLSVSAATETSITLSWSENTDPDFSRFEIFMSTSPGELGVSIANITDQSVTSYEVTDLEPGKTYYFTIRVWDTVGLHSDSEQVEASTLVPTPFWSQPWFLGTVAVIILAVIAVAAYALKRRAP